MLQPLTTTTKPSKTRPASLRYPPRPWINRIEQSLHFVVNGNRDREGRQIAGFPSPARSGSAENPKSLRFQRAHTHRRIILRRNQLHLLRPTHIVPAIIAGPKSFRDNALNSGPWREHPLSRARGSPPANYLCLVRTEEEHECPRPLPADHACLQHVMNESKN
jgi:hypothetical protein